MNVHCPKCQALFRVDPERVPGAGARVRCSHCSSVFLLTRQGAAALPAPARAAAIAAVPQGAPPSAVAAAPVAEARPARAPAPAPAPAAAPAPPRRSFAAQDPDARALRIARALVSDIVAYNPDRREKSLASGTLRVEFREEIMKSWEEYVAQVGSDLAKKTPHFRAALNEILAKGQAIF